MSFRKALTSDVESLVMSIPLYKISPAVAFSNCKIALAKVDLPQPDSPTNPKVSPSYSLKLTSSTALKI